MSPKARTVTNRLSSTEMNSYEVVKSNILKEFRLTSVEYKRKFSTTGMLKAKDETFNIFAIKLKTMLKYYINSKQVDNDFDKLVDLLVADRLKESLNSDILQFVVSKEGVDVFTASQIADLYVNNRIGQCYQEKGNKPEWVNYKLPVASRSGVTSYNVRPPVRNFKESSRSENKWTDRRKFSNLTQPNEKFREGNKYAEQTKKCYICSSSYHLANACPRKEKKLMVNTCVVESKPQFQIVDIPDKVNDIPNASMKCTVVVNRCVNDVMNELPACDDKVNCEHKDKPFHVNWLPEHENAFQELKQLICSEQVLTNFESGRVTKIYCDSSDYAIGALLAQMTDNKTEKPVAFLSCKLTEVQRNWAAIEKEAYAVIWALNKFKIWILGNSVIVFTDHNPLLYVANNKTRSAKLMRWCLALQI